MTTAQRKKRSHAGPSMDDRRRQLLQTIDEIARIHGYGANYRDLCNSLSLSTTYVRTLMLDHQRAGLAEPIAGKPHRGWKLTDAGVRRLKGR